MNWPPGGARGASGEGEGGAGGGVRADAVRLMSVAEQFLGTRDLEGSRKFAECAMEADPLVDGAERVLAASDVLLAARRGRINNHVDWYAVLQLDSPTGGGCALADVRLQYRRLSLLLNPLDRQPSPSSSVIQEAFKLVCDAWTVLSNPVKKELYDKEIAIAAAARMFPNGGNAGRADGDGIVGSGVARGPDVNADGTFWTFCRNCYSVHQYKRGYEGKALLCHNCRKEFLAMELASPPPVVPGTDMYQCAWGLFPLGFPGAPHFASTPAKTAAELGRDAAEKPWNMDFSSVFPFTSGSQVPVPMSGWMNPEHGIKESDVGKKRVQGDEDVSENPKSSADKEATPQVAISSETSLPVRLRRKVVVKRIKRVVSCHAEFEAGNPENKDNAELPNMWNIDVGCNEQGVGCSKTNEAPAGDAGLDFGSDADATNTMLSGMSKLPFLDEGKVVVVD